MSALSIRVDRILGAGAFREIGKPLIAELSPDGALIVVGGNPGWLQWHGQDVCARAGPRYRLAVYDGLACLHLVRTYWPPKTIVFHPTLPIVTIGTGSYDGGWSYEGELLSLNLETGSVVTLLERPREVRRLTWKDERTLDIVLAVLTDEDEERLGTASVACSIQRADWDSPTPGMLENPREEVPVPDGEPSDPAAATALVEQYCRRHGAIWEQRRATWAVRALPDGRFLSALEDVALECWSSDSDEVAWRLPAEGIGCQVHVSPNGKTAFTLTQAARRWSQASRTWIEDPSVVTEVALEGGEPLRTWDIGSTGVLTVRSDGWWAVRDASVVRPSVGLVTLRAPGGHPSAIIQLGRYDLFNHYFDIRYAPDLLFLQGSASKPWKDKWVVAADAPSGAVRRLFPLEWDEGRGRHLFGGPGAYLSSGLGAVLIHAGTIHDGRGLLPGNSFVVCRAYPSGEPLWVFTTDVQATDLDTDGDYIYVTFNSGELVVLRATDGAVHARLRVRVDGRDVIPLSLALAGHGRAVIGTLDGSVLDCSIDITSER